MIPGFNGSFTNFSCDFIFSQDQTVLLPIKLETNASPTSISLSIDNLEYELSEELKVRSRIYLSRNLAKT